MSSNEEGGSATLQYGETTIELPVYVGNERERAIDISNLRANTGMVTIDYGFGNTASTKSGVSFVDGAAGELRYRGYRIEDLAEHCSFLEVCWLLLHGDLPAPAQLETYVDDVTQHTLLNEEMRRFFDAFPRRAHPMAIVSAATSAIGAFYQQYRDPDDPVAVEQAAMRLIAKLPTMAAWAYKKSKGQPYIYPRNDLDYAANFLHMMFAVPADEYKVDPVAARALDVILILHGDHGQNASTSTARLVGSTGASIFASMSSGMNALWGWKHGGANQAVVEMLHTIHTEGGDYERWIERAKDRDDPFRLVGFGHRVYKNYDPRARILKGFADDVVRQLGIDDPLVELAQKLEATALADDFFVERKLYPNVDFYSGLIFRALGFPTEMFTVLFTLGRLPGWISQWMEMLADPHSRIGRPRQLYTGPTLRDFVPVADR